MSLADALDPTASVQAFYATDLRKKREEHGVTQREFAKLALMAPSLLNKIEAGVRLPTKELSELADGRFGTGDYFQRLWPLVIKFAFPKWFRPFVDLEEAARIIRSFQVQVVDGLLQTEEYARAVMSGRRLERAVAAEQVAARMQRQEILNRDDRPDLWVVLDELVLRRHIASPSVMLKQFERLIAEAEAPRTVLQVLPFDSGAHAGLGGPFSALTLDEGPGLVVVDGFLQGQILADPDDVAAADRAYDLLTAHALSPRASIDRIVAAMKDLR
ncbi:Scr1 family TA system antitoxin-like transcriptional regulator [Kitasatospora viridis]|uniref:Helix-turn-helix protein n=1 Tax=Kitasatospora viridis TaxID=281105 RepID=A0A561ULA3_9ACTN|nr:Scr1 family TA system antitoxin-like transcriptional regulator [Kitasatospora viridis]TWG00144.1 helix-turn-helix protein [Kitasatospora viridis]